MKQSCSTCAFREAPPDYSPCQDCAWGTPASKWAPNRKARDESVELAERAESTRLPVDPYSADDALGFLWSTIRLIEDDEVKKCHWKSFPTDE